MPHRFALTSLALFTTLGLAACNASPQPVASATPVAVNTARVAATVPDLQLPEGAICSDEITRYSTITTNDYNTGYLSPSIYDQITVEIAKAADACRAGQDAQARALVAASKHKHGYPS
jgi:hypothetical protein